MTHILGISGYYHDSAAALIEDGQLVHAAQEERFTRLKHDASFPSNSVNFCLAGLDLEKVDHIVFYDKPILKFERLLETHLSYAPAGVKRFHESMPSWLKEKLFLKQRIRQELANLASIPRKNVPPILFTQHHESHAGSAFYCSPFQDAAILCVDGVGEWATTSAWVGSQNGLEGQWQINFPHSLGLLYSAFTYFCGFKVNDGEYKLMGLAPYGNPVYVNKIRDHLIDIKEDGTFRLDLGYFDYGLGSKMSSGKFCDLFSSSQRVPESEIRQIDMDLAASIQAVVEEVLFKLASELRQSTGLDNLCLAGGVALNCVANGHLRKSGLFKRIWVQPAAGDAGGAVGAAMCVWHDYLGHQADPDRHDKMRGCLLGTTYSDNQIAEYLDSINCRYERLTDEERYTETAMQIAQGKVVGWFQDNMEFGPRSLGSRSILGDARAPDMQRKINTRIKFRESFRPFAPAVLEEDCPDYFDTSEPSPYMLFVEKVKPSLRTSPNANLQGTNRVDGIRSNLPAITHLDYSARLQTVSDLRSPSLHALIKAFKSLTGCSVLINTSFNVRGEPIVESPADAYRCFMQTDMDCLVLGTHILYKEQQSNQAEIIPAHISVARYETSEIKKFSRSLALITILLFVLIFPYLYKYDGYYVSAAGLFALLLFVLGELKPQALNKPLFYWHKFGRMLSKITSPVLLGLIYFLVVTPIGILKRIVGQRTLELELDARIASYKERFMPNEDMRDPF